MIPQPQTVLHEPALRRPGNCFAACIASILEVPVSGVPAPGTEDFDHWSNYWPRLAEWLHGRGMAIVQIQFDEPVQAYQTFWTSTSCLDDPGPYYISSGNSHEVAPLALLLSVLLSDSRR